MSAEKHAAGEIAARIGLISDTHGELDDRALVALEGVDIIVHAGDIESDSTLYELEAIAPVTAVLGNCDREIVGFDVDRLARTTVAGVRVLAIHDLARLGPVPSGVDLVVCGHTHEPMERWHGSVLVVNPGSASRPRNAPSRSVAIVAVDGAGELSVEFIELDDVGPAPA
jgi:putative phosphoesterase